MVILSTDGSWWLFAHMGMHLQASGIAMPLRGLAVLYAEFATPSKLIVPPPKTKFVFWVGLFWGRYCRVVCFTCRQLPWKPMLRPTGLLLVHTMLSTQDSFAVALFSSGWLSSVWSTQFRSPVRLKVRSLSTTSDSTPCSLAIWSKLVLVHRQYVGYEIHNK